jgi:hypothetical protein
MPLKRNQSFELTAPALVGAKKGLLQAAQKDLEARRLSGNEAYGPFFSRLLDK